MQSTMGMINYMYPKCVLLQISWQCDLWKTKDNFIQILFFLFFFYELYLLPLHRVIIFQEKYCAPHVHAITYK